MDSFKLISNEILGIQKKFNEPIKKISYSDFLNQKSYLDVIYDFGNNTPLINKGFKGTFNLSLIEHLWSQISISKGTLLSEDIFDYTSFQDHFVYLTSKCFRFNDVDTIIEGSDSINHSLLFHMATVTGVEYLTKDTFKINRHIEYFIEFLAQFIDMKKLQISIFQGGTIEKHNICKFFPKDPNYDFYLKLSKKYGFKLIETNSETFLTLKIYGSPSMWGYRNEFLYSLDNKELLDIGTFEFLNYVPKFDFNKEVTYSDVVLSEKVFIGSVIGIERFSMILEDKKELYEVSFNHQLIELIKNNSQLKTDSKKIFLTSEILKVLLFIISENGSLDKKNMTKKRRRKVYYLLDLLVRNIVLLNITIDIKFLEQYFDLCKISFYFDKFILNNNPPKILYNDINHRVELYLNKPSYRKRIDRYG